MDNLLNKKLRFRILSTSLVLCICFQCTFALSVKDILYNQETVNIVDAVSQHAEPYCRYWKPDWESPALKNSVKTVLYYALSQVDSLNKKADPNSTLSFLSGIIWHHLYQVEVDSAFAKADSIADWMLNAFPQKQTEATWLKGVNLVKAAQITQGFRLLENLHTVEHENSGSFLKDYATLLALCFLPKECVSNDALLLDFLPEKRSVPFTLKPDELTPKKETWQTVSELSNGQKSIPTIIFSTEFSFSPPIKLVFPPLKTVSDLTLGTIVKKPAVPQKAPELFFGPSGPKHSTEIKVIIDRSKQHLSVEDHAIDIVWNNYDMVKEVDELDKVRGISLRCYKRSYIKNVPGEFYAYAVFDKNMHGNRQSFYQPSNKKTTGPRPSQIRYIIALKASKAVEDKAESLFQGVVSKFN